MDDLQKFKHGATHASLLDITCILYSNLKIYALTWVQIKSETSSLNIEIS